MPKDYFDHNEETLTGNYSHRCRSCSNYFTALDQKAGLFHFKTKTCERCTLLQKMEKDESIVLPSCFGESYDGMSLLCTKTCKVRNACIISFIEHAFKKREKDYTEDQERQINLPQTIVYRNKRVKEKNVITMQSLFRRLLKSIGRPIHLMDLAPSIAMYYPQNSERQNCFSKSMYVYLRSCLNKSKDVVSLGQDLFVHRDYWNPAMGGKINRGSLPRRRKGQLSVEEIIAGMTKKAEEEEKNG